MCLKCDLHVTAVYFKRLSTENDCDTNRTGFGHWLTLCTLNMHVLTYLIAVECDYKP